MTGAVTVLLFLLVPALLCQDALGGLPPPESPYNILMLLPSGSRSHRNVFLPLATALTERGHKITMLSSHPAPDQNPNIRYVEHGLQHFNEDNVNMFEIRKDPGKMFELFSSVFPLIARDLYTVPAVKELYNRRKQFDLIVIDHMFNEATYPFAFELPFITISTSNVDPAQSAVMGNLLNPAYVANYFDDYPRPYTFVSRLKNIFSSIMMPYLWRSSILHSTQVEISKQFPHLIPLAEIERNQSLTLINTHFSFSQPLPLLPGQVMVGGMHLKPAQPLPKDLQEFLDGETPVVYMSLGSVAKSSDIPKEYVDVVIGAFSKLPYKVIWKYEEERKDLPKNVLIRKWMPQQDVLAHPNTKVFISHCGLLGSQEAMYHGTPMLGLPIFGDQPKNAKTMQNNGMGLWLEWSDITEQSLIDAIIEIIKNPKYKEKMSGVSKAFRDQLESPLDRAVFWTEYVIRHDGAVHLRSPERDLSWIEVLYLDALLVLHLIMFAVIAIIKKLVALCFGSKGNESQKKNNKKKRE